MMMSWSHLVVSFSSYVKGLRAHIEIDDESTLKRITLEAEEGLMVGSDVFSFRTPKKSGQMAQKASEAKTPKSAAKEKEPKTPKSALKTPKSKSTTPGKNARILEDGDSSSDNSISSESDSDSETEDKSTNQKPASGRSRQIVHGEDMLHNYAIYARATTNAEDYFDLHSEGAVTSDRTLSKLETPRLDHEALSKLLKNVTTSHPKHTKEMLEDHSSQFSRWMFNMCNGFNILLYGLGSKRALLEEFRKSHLVEFNHIVVNGYFPSLTIKHILNIIKEDIIDVQDTFKSPLDQYEYIRKYYEESEYEDFYMIIHNIDGAMLRAEKVQNILSLLAQIRGFHIIASIDHINAPLIWDHTKCSRYNWIWYDCTTYISYSSETSYENSLLVQQSGALALSSLTHVMKSLTPNAKGIFLLLAKHQLENKDNSTYIGMSFHDLYQRCRESFLVNSDLTLNAQLIEFRDHKLIRSKKSYDGAEHLLIPIDPATLAEFLDQQADS
ncbi:hypothetical protein LOTGIDRAFT_161593 [Lottia gigantea]|uniref:Origin recognition complex subunit 2 n=1 Tax=Lottia gigantea TaxID=225164 RepID=V4AEC9_LOTGI|nr:hypothetical protein LOTGIDRAFT_161593 [Lottia gigantea]ESO93490.1 hypothetical protein LOTGIDRAFT_161593 [Lottia gigantea]